MLEIRSIHNLHPQDIRRLNVGYTSPAMYRVRKIETNQCTTIEVDLVELQEPYRKSWETDDDELARLQETVAEKLSLAAYDGNEMVAIAINGAQRWNRTLWVWEFHVLKDYQRQGIGRRLMEAVFDMAKQTGMRAVLCETQNTNVPAIRFYRQMGFEIEGIDLSYYTNDDVRSGEVAIFMKHKL